VQAVSTDPSASFSEITKAASDPRMFVLLSEGNDYIFEISICEDVSTKSGALPMQADFDAHRVTDEQFMKQPELLQDIHLFVRFRDRYFGWENGHPILATLDLYRKALLEAQPKQAATASKGTWSRWWGRGQARGRTTTEGSVSTGPSDNDTEKDAHLQQSATEVSKKTSRDITRSSTLPYLSSNPPPLVSTPSAPQVQTADSSSQEEVPQPDTATVESAVAQQKHYAKTLRLTSDQLKTLNLKKGVNNVSFTVQSSFSGVAVITARIFLWRSDYQIVISDIDGTITK
jgi:phosphatidate phosphatase LPIN